MNLSDYDISPTRGFIPHDDPLESLPAYFKAWDELALNTPLLIMTSRIYDALENLPLLDASHLKSKAELQRAMLLLAAFANIWLTGSEKNRLPPQIAVPLIYVAKKQGLMPLSAHATIVLTNFKRLDKSKPLSLNNIDTLINFKGSLDEKWFFLATLGVELAGAPIMPLLLKAVACKHSQDLTPILTAIANGIQVMTKAFFRVRESCDPYIFYNHVRPYLAGLDEKGVEYEGTGLTLHINGGSAAQSSLLQSIDAALFIRHEHELTSDFLTRMRDYMPPLHKQFILDIRTKSKVREHVQQGDAALKVAYNHCIEAMDELRRRHIGLASDYITKQMPKNASNLGTGGTDFHDFLRQSRLETISTKIID